MSETHNVPIEFVLQMQEMDGTPEESAHVVLDVYIDDIRKAIEDVTGSAVIHIEVTDPDLIDQPEPDICGEPNCETCK